MNQFQIKITIFILLIISYNFILPALSQSDENEINYDPIKKYDEILNGKASEPTATPQEKQEINIVTEPIDKQSPEVKKEPTPKIDDLVLLLPVLNSGVYENWSKSGNEELWKIGNNLPEYITSSHELLIELGLEKVLKQSYKKENHNVNVIIYKFTDFTGAYSAYTILHSGTNTKLKIGKNASESEKLVDFWKGDYYIDIHTVEDNDSSAKEFIVLSSQDISKNIQSEQLPPVVAIQLPSLNRVQGSEKYCIGVTCCNSFISKELDSFNCNFLNLQNSGGVIAADYQLPDDTKQRIKLILTRYTKREDANALFNLLQKTFETKKNENKEIDIDEDIQDSIIKIKNKKNDYIMFKQKGNLVAIAYNITNKKSGEQIIGLVPWPIEINKPLLREEESKPK